MAKTYQDVVTEARVLLQDDAADRYSDTVMIAILNRALQALCRLRPDACTDLFAANSLNVPEVVEASPGPDQVVWTANFEVEMQFYNPVLHYVVGMAELVDDEYSEDGRAVALLGQFKSSVIGL